MKTTERLAVALEAAGAPVVMIERARNGYYDDYLSPLDMPLHALVDDATRAGLHTIASRARSGEFDATREEADAWARSADGQAVFRSFFQ